MLFIPIIFFSFVVFPSLCLHYPSVLECFLFFSPLEPATLIMKKVKVKIAQSCPTLCDPCAMQSMEFSSPEYCNGWPFPSPGDLPKPGIKPRSPALQVDSLPSEPPGKPKNTGEGSLSLLQRIFPTQELNRRLLHCSRILYQLSYQGTPLY